MSHFGAENFEVAYRFWTVLRIVRMVTIFDKHSFEFGSSAACFWC